MKKTEHLSRLVLAAVFSALAYISTILLPIKVDFLTLDFKDSILTIGALYLGPLAGVGMAALTALVEFMTVSTTGFYGLIMNFLGSATFSTVASLLYTRRKSLNNAILSLIFACLSMTAVMLGANLLITPLFTKMPTASVVGMLLPLLLPFNLVKGTLNASITMLLYKPISKAIRRTRGGKASVAEKPNKYTAYVVIGALLVLAASLAYLFLCLKATY